MEQAGKEQLGLASDSKGDSQILALVPATCRQSAAAGRLPFQLLGHQEARPAQQT